MSDVILHVDPASAWLVERRKRDLDRLDEMWEGVVHVVPPPSVPHQDAEMELSTVLRIRAKELGLRCTVNTGVYDPDRPDHDFRVPDIVVARPEQRSRRGVEGGAVLVAELLSPRDETYEKLPFYAAQRCEQVLIVHPETFALKLLANHDGTLLEVEPDEDGAVTLHTLEMRLRPVPGEGVDASWPGGSAEVRV